MIILALNSFAQVQQEWVAKYNGSQNRNDAAYFLYEDSFENIYIVGSSTENGSGVDVTLLKFNKHGRFIWKKSYTDTDNSNETPVCLLNDELGNILIAGNIQNPGGTLNIGFVLKYNSNGDLIFTKKFFDNRSNWLRIDDMAINNSGNLCLSGYSAVISDISNSNDIVNILLTPNGDTLWKRYYQLPSNFNHYDNIVNLTNLNEVYVLGYMVTVPGNWYYILQKYSGSGELLWERTRQNRIFYYLNDFLLNQNEELLFTSTEFISPVYAGFLTKINKNGDLIWDKRIALDSNNSYHLGKLYIDDFENIFTGGNEIFNTNNSDYSVFKLNTEGNIIWHKNYNGDFNGNDNLSSIVTDNSGNLFITGTCQAINSNNDIVSIKYDQTGATKWIAKFDPASSYYESSFNLRLSNDFNSVYICGAIEDTNSIYTDYLLLKYSQLIGISPISSEIPEQFSLSQNHPNPFNPSTKIKFEIPLNVETTRRVVSLRIFDVLGREVRTLVNENLKPGVYEADFNAAGLPSGVYFYKLNAGNFTETKKMIITLAMRKVR